MPTKAFLRGNELRKKIGRGRENEVISLPLLPNDFGEYQGPIVIEKPITLVGRGDKTPILAKGCPAIIVLSAGVKLSDIEVADSFDTVNGVALLVREGVQPVFENVKINGQMITMSKEQLIDLGDFLPQQLTSSYLEVEVSGPSRVKCTESSEKWLRVVPEHLPVAGKHLVQFICDGSKLGLDAFSVGNVEIMTGTTVNTLWVTVHTLPAPPAKTLTDPIALLLGKDHRIRFIEGFFIGKNKFAGVSAASSIAERQSIILKDKSSGIWTIYQPWKTAIPTVVDGVTLFQGQRICLQDGSILRMGSLELKVELFKGSGLYAVDKSLVNLGAAGDPTGDKGFKLRYNGGGKDKPKILANVPWLEVKPDSIEFQKGEEKEIQVNTTPAVSSLPKVKNTERSAILIQTKTETLSIDVSVDVKADTIIPRAVPDQINWGVVSDWEKTQGTITLYNDGVRDWKPSVRLDCDWLNVEPAMLLVPAGKSSPVTMRLNHKIENLPSPGSYKASIMFEGDAVSLKVIVSVQLQLPKPEPLLDTPTLDFKELDDVSQAVPATLIVRNKGNKEWKTSVSTKLPWIDILGDTNFIVLAGGQKTLPVQINGNIPVGDFSIADGVVLTGDGKTLNVAIKVKLKPPSSSIEIFPRIIDFGKFDDLKSATEQKIAFRNRGNAEWVGTVRSTVPWLAISPSSGSWNCAAKSEITAFFKVVGAVPEGPLNIADAVVFDGSGGGFKLSARLEYAPIPKVRSIPIDFGEVSGWEAAPQVTIPIYNDGGKDWENVQVAVQVPWLNVTPSQLNIPKSGKGDIQVRLNSGIERLSSGEQIKNDAILLSGMGVGLPISAKVTLPPVELQVSNKEIGFSVEYETDVPSHQQKIVVKNIGRRDWTGKIEARVDWLKVEPDSASIGVRGSLNILVSTTDKLGDLSTGEQLFGSLITFENASLALDVRVNIKKITPKSDILDFDPNPLDLGKIEPGSSRHQSQKISIYSELDWRASVVAQDNWLVPVKGDISGSAGKETYLAVETTDPGFDLDEGVHWSELVFTIQNGKRFTLPVKVEKAEIPPAILVTPVELNYSWGSDITGLPPQKLVLENKNDKDWEIWVESDVDWIEVVPANRITCPARGKVDFLIKVLDKVASFRDGKYTQDLRVRIGPKHKIVCGLVLNIDRTIVEWSVKPDGVISLGSVEKSADSWNQHPGTELLVMNKGDAPLDIQVAPKVDWLEVAVSTLKIPPKSTRKIEIALKKEAWQHLRLGNQESFIEFKGAGKFVRITLTLILKAIKRPDNAVSSGLWVVDNRESDLLPLIINSTRLTFGPSDISKWRSESPQFVVIQNQNTNSWVGQIEVPEWLTANPTRLDIPANSSISVEIKLKPSLFGSAVMESAFGEINIFRGNERYSIQVDLTHPGKPSIPAQEEPVEKVNVPHANELKFLKRNQNQVGNDLPSSHNIQIMPSILDFGRIEKWDPNIYQKIQVENPGNVSVDILLKPSKWFNVPDVVTVPAHGTLEVKVFLKRLSIFDQPKSDISDNSGLVIINAEQSIPIRIDLKLS